MFLEMQILAVESRFANLRAASVFPTIEDDQVFFLNQRQEHWSEIIAKAYMKSNGIYVIRERREIGTLYFSNFYFDWKIWPLYKSVFPPVGSSVGWSEGPSRFSFFCLLGATYGRVSGLFS